MARNFIKADFLKLEEETYADAAERKKKRAAAADPDDALQSDNDEDDKEVNFSKDASEEQGNASPFLRNLPPSAPPKDARASSSTTKALPIIPTRETMAAALKKSTRPLEAVGVMLEPLRSISPSTEDSGSRPESNTPTSDSSGSIQNKPTRNETIEKMNKFKPIDLENFYKDITNGNLGYPLNAFAFGSSTIEEVFAKTLILNSHDNAEEKFMKLLATVLESQMMCIDKIL